MDSKLSYTRETRQLNTILRKNSATFSAVYQELLFSPLEAELGWVLRHYVETTDTIRLKMIAQAGSNYSQHVQWANLAESMFD